MTSTFNELHLDQYLIHAQLESPWHQFVSSVDSTSHPTQFVELADVPSISESDARRFQSFVDDQRRSACLVCNDFSSSHHYGVRTCEGCKGFFKVSSRQQRERESLFIRWDLAHHPEECSVRLPGREELSRG